MPKSPWREAKLVQPHTKLSARGTSQLYSVVVITEKYLTANAMID